MIVGVDFGAPQRARDQRRKIIAIAAHSTGWHSYRIDATGMNCARAGWLMAMSAAFVRPIVSARAPAGQYGHRAERSCAPRAMPRDGGAGSRCRAGH